MYSVSVNLAQTLCTECLQIDAALRKVYTMDSLTLATWVVAGLAVAVLLLCAFLAGFLILAYCR